MTLYGQDNQRTEVGFWGYWLKPIWAILAMPFTGWCYRQEIEWEEWYDGIEAHRTPLKRYLRKVKL